MSEHAGAGSIPVDYQTQRGYDPPTCTQFGVFLPNKVGRLKELLSIFTGRPIRIAALAVNEASDHAVVRLVTSRSDETRQLLEAEDWPFTESELLVPMLKPKQRLVHICTALLSAELSIYYAYPLMVSPQGHPTIALHTDNQVLAGQILHRKGFEMVGEEQIRAAFGEGA